MAEFAIQTAVARSDFYALVDAETYIGCGLCATVCPVEAIRLARRAAREVVLPPAGAGAWRARRNGKLFRAQPLAPGSGIE